VAFSAAEIQFYSMCFLVSSFACLSRLWRDNERLDLRTSVGRCLSSGVLGFGTIGIWIGRDPSSLNGGSVYYLAIAALVGYVGKDLQDQLLNRLVRYGMKKTGLEDSENAGTTKDDQSDS
jgi:hypothetical protein